MALRALRAYVSVMSAWEATYSAKITLLPGINNSRFLTFVCNLYGYIALQLQPCDDKITMASKTKAENVKDEQGGNNRLTGK